MSTAIQVPGGIILGGTLPTRTLEGPYCPSNNTWYKGEKQYLQGLKSKFLNGVQKTLDNAESLIAKTASAARSRAQAIFDKAESDIEARMEVVKDTEASIYEEAFPLSQCVYTNSGHPFSIHMRMVADAESKRVVTISNKAYGEIKAIQQRNPVRSVAKPKSKPTIAKGKPKASPKRIPQKRAAPTPQVIACMGRINRLLSIGAITKVGIKGGSVRAHCEGLRAKSPALGTFNKNGKTKAIILVILVILAVLYFNG